MGRKVGDLFGQLGVSAEVLQGRLGEIAKSSLKRLENLKTAYGTAALEANKFGKALADGRANIPPFAWNPLPSRAMNDREAFLHGTYFEPPAQAIASSSDPFPGLLNARTKRRTELAMLLMSEESVRSSFEKTAGGRVVVDGRMDGKISMLDASSAAAAPAGGASGVAVGALSGGGGGGYGNGPISGNQNLYKLLMSMDQAVLDQAQKMRPGASQFWELDVGMGRIVGEDEESEESSSEDEEEDAFPHVRTSALTGPTTLLQPQQQGGDSVDNGTLRLKQLMAKRDQMYDIVNKVHEKFNNAANQSINNMKA